MDALLGNYSLGSRSFVSTAKGDLPCNSSSTTSHFAMEIMTDSDRTNQSIGPRHNNLSLSITKPKKSKLVNTIKNTSLPHLPRIMKNIISIPPHNPHRRTHHHFNNTLLIRPQLRPIYPIKHFIRPHLPRKGNLNPSYAQVVAQQHLKTPPIVSLCSLSRIKELEKLEERRCQKLEKDWTKTIKKKPEIGRRVFEEMPARHSSITDRTSSETLGHHPDTALVAIQFTQPRPRLPEQHPVHTTCSTKCLLGHARQSQIAINFPRTQPTHTTCSMKCLLGNSRTDAGRDPFFSASPVHTRCSMKCLLGISRTFSASDHLPRRPRVQPVSEPMNSARADEQTHLFHTKSIDNVSPTTHEHYIQPTKVDARISRCNSSHLRLPPSLHLRRSLVSTAKGDLPCNSSSTTNHFAKRMLFGT
ncbi:hypothetical protein LXL04_025967 [Taraxacum kok-saghyz]